MGCWNKKANRLFEFDNSVNYTYDDVGQLIQVTNAYNNGNWHSHHRNKRVLMGSLLSTYGDDLPRTYNEKGDLTMETLLG